MSTDTKMTVEEMKAALEAKGFNIRGHGKRTAGTIGRKGTSVFIPEFGQIFFSKIRQEHIKSLTDAGIDYPALRKEAQMWERVRAK